jgi:hypothetical protein
MTRRSAHRRQLVRTCRNGWRTHVVSAWSQTSHGTYRRMSRHREDRDRFRTEVSPYSQRNGRLVPASLFQQSTVGGFPKYLG